MNRKTFFACCLLGCSNAYATGSPLVFFSYAGRFVVLGIIAIYILFSTGAWRQKLCAVAALGVGALVVFAVGEIPDYQQNSKWIEWLSWFVVISAVLLSIFVLRKSRYPIRNLLSGKW